MDNTLLTALFASSLALLGLTVAKDGKVSEFRQEWIDGLRADVAEFLANVQHVFAASRGIGNISPDSAAQALLRVNGLSSRIRLRLDPKKPKSQVLIDDMKNFRDVVMNSASTEEVMMESAHTVEESTGTLLDEAWERVKRGEDRFRFCILLSIIGLVVSVFGIVYSLKPHLWCRW
jgi:hypothetical protein